MIVGLVATYLWISMLTAPWKLGGGLLDAADHFQRAQKKLTAGALKDARYETLAGVAAAERAREGLRSDSPLYDLAELVPKVNAALDEANHFVAAAQKSSLAVQGTLDIAQNALRGPDKIIGKDPEDEKGGARIRIDRIREIAGTVGDIRKAIVGVKDELGKVKLERLPRRLRPRVEKGIEQADETDKILQQAEAGLAILPRFLGADEPRTYLFGMQNSAEQRGTGGAMLQFALMSISNGSPELLPASTVYDVDENRDPVPLAIPEDAWYVRGIPDAQRFGNANWSPDWPLSATLTLDYAEASEPTFPRDVDGVFAITPVAMQKLMPGVGPYRLPTGNRISAGKIVHFVLYKAYASFPIPKVRRARLREVVDLFYERMLRPDHPSELVKGFGESLAEKHMQIWMADPAEQAFVEKMNWDGAIEPAKKSDYLFVVQQNVGGNKLNYFEKQHHIARVTLDKDGNAHHNTTISIDNDVFMPQPRWSMGDSGPLHRPMINIYAPGDATLLSGGYDGELLPAAANGLAAWTIGSSAETTRPPEHTELGKKVWSGVLEIKPQEKAEMHVSYDVPNMVQKAGNRYFYRLLVQYQPKIDPETLTVEVKLPPGATKPKGKGFKGDDRGQVWEGKVTKDMILEVSWRQLEE